MNHMRSRQARRKREKSEAFELVFFKVLVIFVCLVIGIQIIMRFESVRVVLNESIELEGKPLAKTLPETGQSFYPWLESVLLDECKHPSKIGFIYFRFIDEPKNDVWILLNGKTAKRITPEDCMIIGKHGDLIEITAVKGTYNIVVSGISSNILYPHVGTWVKGEGILPIGTVIFTEH